MDYWTVSKQAFRRWSSAAACLAGATLAGCSLDGGGACTCTTSFQFHAVEVRDADGQAVDSALVRIFRVSDGKEISDSGAHSWHPGQGKAVVISDSQLRYFPVGSSTMGIRVVVSKGGKSGEGSYTVESDPPDCRCHIGDVAGPDTLVLR